MKVKRRETVENRITVDECKNWYYNGKNYERGGAQPKP